MGIKSRIIKHVVINNTYDVLMGMWKGIKKFVRQFRLFIKNEQGNIMNKDTYTESENEEKEMNKRYSGRGNQDADLFKK